MGTRLRLHDKVAIITGAGSGMGLATAELFTAEGAKVLVADINADQAEAVAARLGPAAAASAVDVRSADSVKSMIEQTVGAFGRIDILVNNAGKGTTGTVVTTAPADWNDIIATNLNSVFLCSKYAIPVMTQGGGGVIVNIASNVAVIGKRDRAAYIAAKGAVAALTRAMALDHVTDNIRVNAVAPGAIWTSYFDKMLEQHPTPDAFKRSFIDHTPMGRFGKPEEIAAMILWLASQESSFATGGLFTVDGGMSVW